MLVLAMRVAQLSIEAFGCAADLQCRRKSPTTTVRIIAAPPASSMHRPLSILERTKPATMT
jgi:hypothetical protein